MKINFIVNCDIYTCTFLNKCTGGYTVPDGKKMWQKRQNEIFLSEIS